MNRFAEELKFAFQRSDNGLIRIILINLIIYVVLASTDVITYLVNEEGFFQELMTWISVPSELENLLFKPWTLFTYMFVHIGFWHILGNMLFLYWFGQLIMDYIGSKKFVNIYVLGGLAGALFFLVFYNVLPPFQGRSAILFGASAGVSAIVVAAATLTPDHSFMLFLLGPIKIKYIALGFIVFRSFLGLKGGNAGGELAHLGGALIGYLYILQLRNGKDIGAWVSASLEWIQGLFKRKSKIRVSHRQTTYTSSRPNYTTTQSAKNTKGKVAGGTAVTEQDEIDAILDKISEKGYESLSKEEKQKLFNASKKG